MEPLNTLADTLAQHAMKATEMKSQAGNEVWFYIALAEMLIILILGGLILCKKKPTLTKKQQLKNELGNSGEIDFQNIINSSFHANTLYDQLKVKCHPDRFVGDSVKNGIAEKIFQEITKNKTNLKKLKELKEEAIQKLNINF